MMRDLEGEIRDWYDRFGIPPSSDRQDLLANPETLFQSFASDRAMIRVLRAAGIEPADAKVLDVGCGDGTSLGKLLPLRFRSANLHGIDVLPERIDAASSRYPGMTFSVDDASAMSYEPETFDLAMAAGMLIQLSDDVASTAARDMLRVTKRSGLLLVLDWRYGKPGHVAVNRRRIDKLFAVGRATSVVATANGPLVPPIGRRLSRYAPSLYFLVQAVAPFAVGARATLLRKS
jgi:ubiquinone/menaquinone biosynthesis C-methylase UbiE